MRDLRLRPLAAPALAGALSLLFLASCAVFPFLSQSPSELATGADTSWYKASAFHFKGSMAVSEGTLQFNLTESADSGQGRGSGTLAGKPFSYLAASSNEYLKGQSFWQAYYGAKNDHDSQTLARGFEEKYAVATGNDVSNAMRELVQLGGDISQLQTDAHSFKKGGTRTIDGKQATRLAFAGDTFWVVEGSPDQLVGFKAATAGDLRDVNVTIASTKVPGVTAPAQGNSVDPLQPQTLPAQYTAFATSSGDASSCTPNGCLVAADVTNNGGTPEGVSTVQITAQDPNTNADIASCTANIPAIPTNQSQTVSCTISGAAWKAWATNAANAGGGFFSAVEVAKVTANPPYTGASGG